ncbi:MAG: UDP-N-acetylglucosamine 2-epimerase (non-hydrolyzing) [Acidobacteria bacterium]|nr:MAG: UDP-N-acetylglucosamine 2-epimerase (non-hydrolyzing) [Acidobacteriota bacterium]PYQ63510.1 MAG: UDP-N-acetylglucosamine 2-epimerase (non-hydrolyzing) [Acidobacteriota bacterium]
MTSPRRILVVVGTRPEAVKLAPVIRRLRKEPARFETLVCATAQHREMLDSVLSLFEIEPDVDLDLMRPDQAPNELASRAFAALDRILIERRPDWLLVQGDTTTAMCAAVAAFHRGVAVGHVEAGLRTGDLARPFPEEMNRRVVDLVADACFAPTRRAADALASEGVAAERIHRTGNTVVDALTEISRRDVDADTPEEDLVLVTAHRRESFGEPLERILSAVGRLARAFPKTRFVHLIHPNPNVRGRVEASEPAANVERIEPLDYRSFLRLLRRCRLVLSDSGGVQEEAPTFGKRVLVLREKTERPEGIEAGFARLVGTDEERIFDEASRILSGRSDLPAPTRSGNPYGDGRAAERIVSALAGIPYEPFEAAAPRVAVV